MTPTFSKEDTLPHIEYEDENFDASDDNLLANQVSGINGNITIVAFSGASLVLDWHLGLKDVSIRVVLKTAFGSKTLFSAELTPSNPLAKIGGSFNGFKAEAEVSFDFSTKVLTASGEICVPLLGCKKGKVSVRL